MNQIDEIKARLDHGRLWQKGSLGDWRETQTPVCLIGACFSVAQDSLDTEVPTEITDVIAEQYPMFTLGHLYDAQVDEFNDSGFTTWADIEAVLEKASLRWDETHA